MNAMEFLRETLDGMGPGLASSEVGLLLREDGAAHTDDCDIAWAVARAAFAVGHRAARVGADLEEWRTAVDRVRCVIEAKTTRYYRIGDSTWTLYQVVKVLGYPDGSRVLLFPVPKSGSYVFDPATPAVTLDGRAVPWPLWEPGWWVLLASKCTTGPKRPTE